LPGARLALEQHRRPGHRQLAQLVAHALDRDAIDP
jgi:hypothetical protein